MLTGMRERENTYSLLIQVQTGSSPRKITADVPQKAIESSHRIQLHQPLLSI